jgi:hypothetical protein
MMRFVSQSIFLPRERTASGGSPAKPRTLIRGKPGREQLNAAANGPLRCFRLRQDFGGPHNCINPPKLQRRRVAPLPPRNARAGEENQSVGE